MYFFSYNIIISYLLDRLRIIMLKLCMYVFKPKCFNKIFIGDFMKKKKNANQL